MIIKSDKSDERMKIVFEVGASGGRQVRFGAYVVACYLGSKSQDEFQQGDLTRRTVSHLCGDGLCVNEDHLVYEEHSINMERKYCSHKYKISAHFQIGSDAIDVKYNPCMHNPHCLLPELELQLGENTHPWHGTSFDDCLNN